MHTSLSLHHVHTSAHRGYPFDAFGDAGDVEVFAIGDTHGAAQPFQAMLEHIGGLPRKASRRVLVHTGDLLDRGPDNLGCLDLFGRMGDISRADEVVALPGNHCLFVLSVLDDPRPAIAQAALSLWLMNGGDDVLDELTAATGLSIGDIGDLRNAIQAHAPFAAWLATMRAAPSHARIGNLVFVHAGVAPKGPIEASLGPSGLDHMTITGADERHWAWIREPFLASQRGFYDADGTLVLVVHGHSPVLRQKEERTGATTAKILNAMDRTATNGRLNLDAGIAFRSNLGAAAFDRDGYRILVTQVDH